jgi:UDP-N-acetylmuramate dehydrogenase
MTARTDAYVEALAAHVPRNRLERGVPLAPQTTFRIGGPADLFFRARTPDDLATVVQAARSAEVPYFLLGRGANILVGDGGFRGLVVRSEVGGVELVDDTAVKAGAGINTYPDLIEVTVARGLGGLHHFVGIPSTVGGALWQNLHFLSPAPERDRTVYIEEILESAEILSEEGERARVGVEYFEFGYDDSILHHRRDVVLTATFRLHPTPERELRRVWRENLEWRATRHPDLDLLPSAGSIFKKIEGVGAGRLIDECGLKGTVRGGAGIFEKHANIIVNLGGASAGDVRALIDLVQETVARQTGCHLVPEIGFVGEFA